MDQKHRTERRRSARRTGEDRSDTRDEAWYQFWLLIEDLLATGKYQWAEPTLRGIQHTVEQSERVTVRQARAVQAIEHAQRQRGDNWARRWPWPID
jgi:hypothetical protein